MTFEFHTVESTLVVDSPILGFRRDLVTMPGGGTAAREVVEHFGAVAVVAYDGTSLALVKQYRRAVDRRLWELPAGLLDIAYEDPLVCAKRELQEEAGLVADTWSLLVDVINSPGFSDEAVRIYLAQDLHFVEKPAANEEELDMETVFIPLDDVVQMVLAGDIHNSIAVAGIMTAHAVLRLAYPDRGVDTPFELRPHALAERRQAEGFHADMKKRSQ